MMKTWMIVLALTLIGMGWGIQPASADFFSYSYFGPRYSISFSSGFVPDYRVVRYYTPVSYCSPVRYSAPIYYTPLPPVRVYHPPRYPYRSVIYRRPIYRDVRRDRYRPSGVRVVERNYPSTPRYYSSSSPSRDYRVVGYDGQQRYIASERSNIARPNSALRAPTTEYRYSRDSFPVSRSHVVGVPDRR